MLFPLTLWIIMLPDMYEDGVFKWVDKSAIQFSNYGSGWPKNTEKMWDSVKNWQNAEAHCTSEQGHLVSFHSQEELSFITGEELRKHIDASDYLELIQQQITQVSVDGTPLSHTNWGYGEPNNHEGREECVEMVSSTNGTQSWWNDLNCDMIYCKKCYNEAC
uniref:C-type lectin domain-containing protein n=1 Tax=Amphiprion ocellaris TaxID=80972 RepID=A0AAQ5Z2R9_AMPOC